MDMLPQYIWTFFITPTFFSVLSSFSLCPTLPTPRFNIESICSKHVEYANSPSFSGPSSLNPDTCNTSTQDYLFTQLQHPVQIHFTEAKNSSEAPPSPSATSQEVTLSHFRNGARIYGSMNTIKTFPSFSIQVYWKLLYADSFGRTQLFCRLQT